MTPRDPYTDEMGVFRNKLGISDAHVLAEHERDLAYFRVTQLEREPIQGRFDFAHLRAIHRYILQDLYTWAGELRTTDTAAFGIPHARPQFLVDEIDRVFGRIQANPPSAVDPDAACDTIAGHWCELTLVHPFRDGNSRSQRVFFDQMFREVGWAVDWDAVEAPAVHAARHMSVFNRYDYLAALLRPAVRSVDAQTGGTLASSLFRGGAHTATEYFRAMVAHHKSRGSGAATDLG